MIHNGLEAIIDLVDVSTRVNDLSAVREMRASLTRSAPASHPSRNSDMVIGMGNATSEYADDKDESS